MLLALQPVTASVQHSPCRAGSGDAEALRTEAASAKEWDLPRSLLFYNRLDYCLSSPRSPAFSDFRRVNSCTSVLMWEVGFHFCMARLELVLEEVMGLHRSPRERDPARL